MKGCEFETLLGIIKPLFSSKIPQLRTEGREQTSLQKKEDDWSIHKN